MDKSNQEFPDEGKQSLNVAYLGPEASFSNQAAINVFTSNPTSQQEQPQVALHPLPSFPAIFSAIQNSSQSKDTQGFTYDYALLPIENSTNGSVVQVLDLLAQCGLDSTALYPDLEVCAEYYLSVHHFLYVSPDATPKPSESSTSPLTPKDYGIRTIYTHPQVWDQCTIFLSEHFSSKETERIDVGSTSAAAQLISRAPKSTFTGGVNAAISSKLAGERHGLMCVEENIEDEPGKNTTRFFVVRNKARQRDDGLGWSRTEEMTGTEQRRYKSLITFTISHRKPGALADALAVFSRHGFNLTSIDTRPGRKRNWQYVFFVECEEASPPEGNAKGEGKVAEILTDLGKYTESLRYLGRFVDRLPKQDDE